MRTRNQTLLLTLLLARASLAAETFDYPELLVTPRATERLEMEAKKEPDRRFAPYIPIQVSALATLTAGISQISSTDSRPIAGIAVGGGWLAVTTIMALSEPAYVSAWREVSALPHATKREQLVRERLAEEAIQKQASLGRRMRWLSFATNAAAAAYMIGEASSGSFSKAADAVAILASVTPLIFRSHWQEVAEDQADYKKRIYGPVASLGWSRLSGENGRMAPSFLLSLRF